MDKWVYELIVEKVPPFSMFKGERAVMAQLVIMLLAGVLISLTFSLPPRSILMGSLAILVVVLWSRLTLIIAPSIRSFRPSLSAEENRIIEEYKSLLFSRWRPELIAGMMLFAPLLTHLMRDGTLFQYYLNGNTYVIAFALILAWDVAYRAGIGMWVSSLNLRRSISLLRASKRREAMDYTLLSDLRTMEKIDRNGVLFGITGFLLVPVLFPDKMLVLATLAYSFAITALSSLSLTVIRRVPWLPPDILELLDRAKFAYVGHAGKSFPHLTPVVQVFDGRNVFFVTSKASKKFSLLREDRKIALLIDERDPRDFFGNKAVMIVGEAKYYTLRNAVTGMPKLLRVFRLFRKKYRAYFEKYSARRNELPEAWRLTPLVKRVPVEIVPEKVVYWRGARKIRIGL
ncbi:pyridoxamine 5'-phosphate oxidase family protein [Geoglobus sp.]